MKLHLSDKLLAPHSGDGSMVSRPPLSSTSRILFCLCSSHKIVASIAVTTGYQDLVLLGLEIFQGAFGCLRPKRLNHATSYSEVDHMNLSLLRYEMVTLFAIVVMSLTLENRDRCIYFTYFLLNGMASLLIKRLWVKQLIQF